jgi:hypothetical protein
VGQAIAKVVGVAPGEDLGFVFEAAEGAGVDDSIAIALIVVAVGMWRFREAASTGLFHVYRVAGQHVGSLSKPSTEYLMPRKTDVRVSLQRLRSWGF